MAVNDEGPELIGDHDTTRLQAVREALRRPGAADPDFLAALAVAVGAILDRELRHSARRKRDEEAAKQAAKDAEDRAKQDAKARASGSSGSEASSATETAAHAAEKKGAQSAARAQA